MDLIALDRLLARCEEITQAHGGIADFGPLRFGEVCCGVSVWGGVGGRGGGGGQGRGADGGGGSLRSLRSPRAQYLSAAQEMIARHAALPAPGGGAAGGGDAAAWGEAPRRLVVLRGAALAAGGGGGGAGDGDSEGDDVDGAAAAGAVAASVGPISGAATPDVGGARAPGSGATGGGGVGVGGGGGGGSGGSGGRLLSPGDASERRALLPRGSDDLRASVAGPGAAAGASTPVAAPRSGRSVRRRVAPGTAAGRTPASADAAAAAAAAADRRALEEDMVRMAKGMKDRAKVINEQLLKGNAVRCTWSRVHAHAHSRARAGDCHARRVRPVLSRRWPLQVLSNTRDLVDRNINAISAENRRLGEHAESGWSECKVTCLLLVVATLLTVFTYMLIRFGPAA